METSQIQLPHYDGNYPQHKAYGTGIGAMPGRVVWSHNPDSVEWYGSGYWWETEHFDEAVILKMVNDNIASLGGKGRMEHIVFCQQNGSQHEQRLYKGRKKLPFPDIFRMEI